MARKFKIMDDDGSKSLCLQEFRKAMRESQVELTEDELQQLFRFFDRDGNGTINYDEFVFGLRVCLQKNCSMIHNSHIK